MRLSPSSPIILRPDERKIKLKKMFKTKLLFRSWQSIGKKSEHSLCVKRTQKAISRIESRREMKILWRKSGKTLSTMKPRQNVCGNFSLSQWRRRVLEKKRKISDKNAIISPFSCSSTYPIHVVVFPFWAIKRSAPSTTTNYVTYLLHVWVGELLQRWAWLKIDRKCQNKLWVSMRQRKKGQANLSRITFTFD